jgi:hypothetical protein
MLYMRRRKNYLGLDFALILKVWQVYWRRLRRIDCCDRFGSGKRFEVLHLNDVSHVGTPSILV